MVKITDIDTRFPIELIEAYMDSTCVCMTKNIIILSENEVDEFYSLIQSSEILTTIIERVGKLQTVLIRSDGTSEIASSFSLFLFRKLLYLYRDLPVVRKIVDGMSGWVHTHVVFNATKK